MALRVLLADNSETIKKVIQLTLKDFDIDLRVVTLGVDVLEVALNFKPEIIFVDILLQKKSGYDVSRELKNNVNLKNTPVVLMWSGFMEFDEPKAKASLADATLEKPFDAETLKNLVTKLVINRKTVNKSDFLEAPTPPPPKSEKHDDPLKSLEKIKSESEKFKPIGSNVSNDLGATDFTANNSSEDQSADDFEMQPLDKTTGFGYRPTTPPPVDHPSISQTKSFVLSLPEDGGSEEIPLEIEKIDAVEDMSFLLNPDTVPTPPAPATPPPPQAKQVAPPKMPDKIDLTPPVTPSASEIENIVRKEVKEAIEKAVWQVVPELAAQMIKKELDRLLKDNDSKP